MPIKCGYCEKDMTETWMCIGNEGIENDARPFEQVLLNCENINSDEQVYHVGVIQRYLTKTDCICQCKENLYIRKHLKKSLWKNGQDIFEEIEVWCRQSTYHNRNDHTRGNQSRRIDKSSGPSCPSCCGMSYEIDQRRWSRLHPKQEGELNEILFQCESCHQHFSDSPIVM